uniref:Alpha-(1,6)-fucosyltransferase n=1 Tax=Meloidogyne javanica TaxID=6303 RepID=A0A915LZB3_MELJA
MKWHNKWSLTNIGGFTFYWVRYVLAALALLWLTLLALVFLQQDIASCPTAKIQRFTESADIGQQQNNFLHPKNLEGKVCFHFINELERLKTELIELQEENKQLKKLASSRDFRPVEPDQFLIHKPPAENLASDYGGADSGLRKVAPLVVAAEQRLKGQLYSKEHEEARRNLQNNIWELFLRINSQEFGKLIGKANTEILKQQFEHILTQSRILSVVDRAPEWHKKVLDKIADRMRESLFKLQNPSDCKNAKLLVCEYSKKTGHPGVILKMDGMQPFCPLENVRGLSIFWVTVPGKPRLGHGPVYSDKYSTNSDKYSNSSPVVGLQIRRTDKVGTEAAFHKLEEYMEWADLWFRIERKRLNFPLLPKRVFIATDDPSVITEAREKYGSNGWMIFGNNEIANGGTAKPNTRYTDRSLLGVITDVRLLAECSYIVCTFSSQVCRIGYELMQTRVGDAGNDVHSIDDIYYFGGQSAHEMEAIDGFKAENVEQIDLNKGDIIGIAGNHWNGWSMGNNKRTGRSGLFPSYLVREKWIIEDFPIFEK